MRRIGVIVAQSVAAVLGVAIVAASIIPQIMAPSYAAADSARLHALLAIVLMTAAVLIPEFNRRAVPIVAVAVTMVLTLAVGAWPHYVYDREKREAAARHEARKRADDAAHDAKALARIEARTRDLEARLADRRPYGGQDALAFVHEVSYVDLKYLGLPDRSAIMLALLKRALAAGLIDPNVPVKGSRPVDVNPEPLFLHYYRAEIRRYPNASIRPSDWDMFKLLVASGADLTLAGGHPIADDLQKSLKADQFGRYSLQ